uniref:CCHC-type domain-containing protein n=1 Tax=Aegilops tauschii subsp. strangulata TaxID=200361 RepID=A0A452ZHL9_AEGTS
LQDASKPRIPRWQEGLCFKCLEAGHFKAECSGEIRCHRCWVSGHIARSCSSLPSHSRAPRPARSRGAPPNPCVHPKSPTVGSSAPPPPPPLASWRTTP